MTPEEFVKMAAPYDTEEDKQGLAINIHGNIDEFNPDVSEPCQYIVYHNGEEDKYVYVKIPPKQLGWVLKFNITNRVSPY